MPDRRPSPTPPQAQPPPPKKAKDELLEGKEELVPEGNEELVPMDVSTGSASGPSEQPTGSASGPAEPACGGSELAGGGSEPAGDGSGALRHVDASTQYPEPAGDGSGAETEARERLTPWRDREQSLPEAAPGEAAPAEENDFHVDIDERGHREQHITPHMVPVNNTLYWDSRTKRFYNSQGVWCDSEGGLLPHSRPAGTFRVHQTRRLHGPCRGAHPRAAHPGGRGANPGGSASSQGPPDEEAQGPPAAAQDPPGGGGSAHTATTAQGFGFPLPTATERGFLLRTTAWDERLQQEVSVIRNAQTGQYEREAQDPPAAAEGPPAAAQGPPAAAQGPPAATRSRRAHSTGPPQDTRRGRANRRSWGSHSSGSRDGDWNHGRW